MRKQVGFWKLAFIVFPLTAVTLDAHFVILGAPNLLFGMRLIFGPHFKRFLGFDGLNSMFVLGLFPADFLHRFSSGIIDSWSSQNKVFVRNVLQKLCFRKNRSLLIREPIFSVFWRPWGCFSDFFCIGNGHEN